mmetsp:Transcript_56205/g.182409  ORF Transcript_56205/g.182409 Transcript_56205/m.182409 type:complete len:224 (-) Transcript_56205:656-1327(-)
MNSAVKGPSPRLPKISAIAWTPVLVPAPISLKSLMKGMFKMSMPLILEMAQPSPIFLSAACPVASTPLTMAPLPSGRCETMPKPGGSMAGDLKVKGPCIFLTKPWGKIIILAQISSGAMISVVPTQLLPKVFSIFFATPKSMSLMGVSLVSSSPHTRMFSHFMSRCTTFLSCMNFKPMVTCLKTPFATSSESLPFAAIISASSPPFTSSMTIILYCACEVPGR